MILYMIVYKSVYGNLDLLLFHMRFLRFKVAVRLRTQLYDILQRSSNKWTIGILKLHGYYCEVTVLSRGFHILAPLHSIDTLFNQIRKYTVIKETFVDYFSLYILTIFSKGLLTSLECLTDWRHLKTSGLHCSNSDRALQVISYASISKKK